MKRLRALFLSVCVAWLLLGLLWERHTINRLDGGEVTNVGGPGYVAGAAVDSFMLKDNELYSVSSLGPQGAGAKDCKT